MDENTKDMAFTIYGSRDIDLGNIAGSPFFVSDINLFCDPDLLVIQQIWILNYYQSQKYILK